MGLERDECVTGKVPYPSKDKADLAVRIAKRMKNETGRNPCRSYKCPKCRWWHVTGEGDRGL